MKRLALLLFLATPATAQVSGEGHIYETACNASGYVLTSEYPVGRFFGSGAGTTIIEGHEVIYLGTSCDAEREGWSTGTWCWANGGFVLEFDEYRIGFPRQELICPEDGFALDFLGCRC